MMLCAVKEKKVKRKSRCFEDICVNCSAHVKQACAAIWSWEASPHYKILRQQSSLIRSMQGRAPVGVKKKGAAYDFLYRVRSMWAVDDSFLELVKSLVNES